MNSVYMGIKLEYRLEGFLSHVRDSYALQGSCFARFCVYFLEWAFEHVWFVIVLQLRYGFPFFLSVDICDQST